nr:synaptobrevin, longin-like domain protein [Tanacetum cinerariifolium]
MVISEAVIREVLRLDDAKGVDCLPNEEIFTGSARMGYEKPSTKLTFYKSFFSSQWKFLIHTILQSMSAKRTSLNEFSSAMASAIICLSTGRKFNFSKYIFNSLVRNVDSSSKFYMYPRIGKGFSGVETSLFEGMLVVRDDVEADIAEEQIPDDTASATAQEVVTTAVLEDLKKRVKKLERVNKVKTCKIRRLKKVGTSQRVETSNDTIMEDVSNQGRMIVELDRDEGVELIGEKEKTKEVKDIVDAQVEGRQAKEQVEIYQIDLDHPSKVLSMQEDDLEVQEAVEVVTTAKLITEVVNAASTLVSAASTIIPTAKQIILAAEPKIPAITITAALVKAAAASTRRRRGVVIKDLEEESFAKTSNETKSKDKSKELNQDTDWDVAIEHVKKKAKEDPFIQIYQVMKKRPQTEAQARRNMMMYLKNTARFRLDYFKGMSYDDIPKRRILNEEANDVEELKQHLEIMPDEDDNVYTEATPLARKVPVVDYQIILLNNKPRYKIIKADGTHQLYESFITMLKNFDRDDLETLWSIVNERFSTSKPNNFSDEYLLTTLKTMFARPDGQENVWKSQRSVHGQEMVKS